MNEIRNDDDLRHLIRQSMKPMSDELDRDLWPSMLRRMDDKSKTVPWLDWALAMALLVLLAMAPGALPILLYQL